MTLAWLRRSAVVVLFLSATVASAHGNGVTGYSGRQGQICTACHTATGSAPAVSIAGPTSLAAGTTGSYTLTISGGPGVDSGIDIATSGGTLATGGPNQKLSSGELTHSTPQAFSAGKSVWAFNLTAPATAGTVTLYAAGNSTNGSGTSGDYPVGVTYAVTITSSTNKAPTIATAAAASPGTVTAKTTSLSVLGADDGGEAALAYTWSSTGPAAVTFSANGTNAAKNTTATFTKAGSYTFTATVKDAQGLTATSSVNVTVQQSVNTVAVTPPSTSVTNGGTVQFSAAATDQFGAAMTTSFTWTASGGGTLSSSGLYTATTVGGPYTVTASSGGKSGTAQVTVTASNQAPTIATAAQATPSPVTGTTTTLSVLGADDGGEAALVYTWTANNPPAAVSYGVNGTNAAKSTVVTFQKAGSYSFSVTARDAQGLTATSAVTVTVNPTVKTVSVAPASVTIAPGASQTFTAAAVDQFGAPMSATFSWSVSGGGSITQAGVFTAGSSAGGPFTVTASTGGKSATASVSISAGSAPTIASPASSSPAVVTGTTATVSVLGAEALGESTLSYTWSALGPAPVAFAPNGTNAAKRSVATFAQAGSYNLLVTVANANGLTTTSATTVKVNATATSVAISPVDATLNAGETKQFSANVLDQFNLPASTPVSWSVSGGGSISATGLFASDVTASGTFMVTATAGAASATISVTVLPASVSDGGTDAGTGTDGGSQPGDTTPPTCSWITPSAGATVNGVVVLEVSASDDVAVSEVRFFVDNVPVGAAVSSPWTMPLDTSTLTEGSHVITASARDAAGNEGTAGQLVIQVARSSTPAGDSNDAVQGGCSSTGGSALALMSLLAAAGVWGRRRARR